MIVKIGFIGAGGVNFGSDEGPWDHASRLERLGPHVIKVVGVADPDTNKAEQVLQKRLQGKHREIWEGATVRSKFQDLITIDKPDAVIIGLPPHCHGLSEPPFNVECVCAENGVHMFIEKPVSSYEPDRLAKTIEIVLEARKRGVITSVGYMFRYSKAVEKMKEIIQEESERRGMKDGNCVTAIMAKYLCAYSLIKKQAWWDVRSSGGPIVEQGTHFADLIRYISESECDLSTLTSYGIGSEHQRLGELTDLPYDGEDGTEKIDSNIAVEHRVPRVTTALWKFNSGAICQLTHGVQLHGSKYESEIEVWGDGLRMTLENPYSVCRLVVRRGNREESNGDLVEVFEFKDDGNDPSSDPYFNEVKCFIDAIVTKDDSLIKSSYEDAFKTYALTWDIKRSLEKNRT